MGVWIGSQGKLGTRYIFPHKTPLELYSKKSGNVVYVKSSQICYHLLSGANGQNFLDRNIRQQGIVIQPNIDHIVLVLGTPGAE